MAIPHTPIRARARRRLGLSTRASLFATGLLAITAALCAAAIVIGLENESKRHQVEGAREVTQRVVRYSVLHLSHGDTGAVIANAERMASRSEVRRVCIHDASGRAIAEQGQIGHSGEHALIERVLRGGEGSWTRVNGEVVMVEPIMLAGNILGAAAITIKPDGFRYDVMKSLWPLLLLLVGLALVAAPLAAFFVRKALKPLDALTRFAETIAETGEAAPIDIRSGDEFETLAGAFNHMIGRLDASMRKIQDIAYVDPVTQLPNQERFQREVGFFILQAQQQREIGAVLVFELQRLSRLLQTLDPDASRDLIRAVAERFTEGAHTMDRLARPSLCVQRPALAARLGAHDFAVFAPGFPSPEDALRFAQQLNAALNQPFEWRGQKISLGAACGVALAPRDGKDADAVLRHARMALSAANGMPARLKVFTQSLDREAVARLSLEREMREALERNEFRAYFQPKIKLSSGKIEGAEALARWVRPDRTIISPARFIPIAEESGLIVQLSEAIMREACWKAAAWAREGMPTKVAVNVSALQFRSERFANQVLQIVKSAGLPPKLLELEITESAAMEDPERALRQIEPLRAAGVRFAIDDFGCGHSSLAALSKLPFDVIKIDQQFVRALESGDGQAEAIVEMILALGRTLKMEIVAEGVEKREQAAFVGQRGCDWIQGFLYGAAMPAADFLEALRRERGRSKADHAA